MVEIVGKLVVPAAGTPVNVYSLLDPAAFPFKAFHAALFQALSSNTGRIGLGKHTMNLATGDDCAVVLAIPTANALPSFGVADQLSPAGVDLTAFWLDADVAGEGVLLTLLTT